VHVTSQWRALEPMMTIMENFDRQHQVPSELGNHTRQSSEKDLHKIIEQIFVKSKVFFDFKAGHTHQHFSDFCLNTMKTIT